MGFNFLVIESRNMDLLKMKFILNETSILTKGCKENSRLGHLDGL